MNTTNRYLDHLKYEVQVVLNCPDEQAAEIVTLVTGLGGKVQDFVKRLPELVGDPQPNAADVIKELQDIRDKKGASRYAVCFPQGYVNRAERRKAKRNHK